MEDITLNELLKYENPAKILETIKPFMKLMMQYQSALLEIKTKFEVLNNELSLEGEDNPIISMSSRIKNAVSLIEKMYKRDLEFSIQNIEDNIFDVAGIRVICAYIKDIYLLADKICSQDDIVVIERKDYIKNPKPNGYRSLHLILEVPVFFLNETKPMKVEVQLRTIAMDSWASLEHKMRYKKNYIVDESISNELKYCAETLNEIDNRMESINDRIFEIKQNHREKKDVKS